MRSSAHRALDFGTARRGSVRREEVTVLCPQAGAATRRAHPALPSPAVCPRSVWAVTAPIRLPAQAVFTFKPVWWLLRRG